MFDGRHRLLLHCTTQSINNAPLHKQILIITLLKRINFTLKFKKLIMAAPPAATDDDDEDVVFNVEEIQKIVRDNIELCLGGNTYSHSRSPQWISNITDKTLSKINKMNKPFKYIMRITITQKNGAGLHTAAAYYWDTATDGSCTVRWENKYMYCIVNIWGLALQI